MLQSAAADQPPQLGRRVVVVGGGNTAMNAARTARRLGATGAIVVYRRTRERMPAHDVEVEQVVTEGGALRWLATVARADRVRLVLERMALDAGGVPQPTGALEELDAGTVVLALGQAADLALLDTMSDMETGHRGVFAGGDMVKGERTVTVAAGHARRAARAIDRWLRGERPALAPRHALATADRLNTWYSSDAPRSLQPQLEPARRQHPFDEEIGGLDDSRALFEAGRCRSCGKCFECDNCLGVGPDSAVRKLGPVLRYAFGYDYCTGCGICVVECPCGAIELEPERV